MLSCLSATVRAEQAPPVAESQIDALFSTWTDSTPGCAVGVSANGSVVLQRAYGMADLEHDVPNTADTIFEAGSVSKQFTAAAILLLVRNRVFEITRRPDSSFRLTPLDTDASSGDLGTIIFRRDERGHPIELSVVQERVWDLRFQRMN